MKKSVGKIRDTDKLLEGIPNLGIYMGDFSEHNAIMYLGDLDGIAEIKGYFIIHEYKKVGTDITPGQQFLQYSLIEKGFTVVNIWHRGPCLNMDLVSAEATVPRFFADGEQTHFKWKHPEADVLDRVKNFHRYWTNQVLKKARQHERI